MDKSAASGGRPAPMAYAFKTAPEAGFDTMLSAFSLFSLAGVAAALFSFIGFVLVGPIGLLYGFLAGVLFVFLGFAAGDSFLLRRYGAQPLDDPQIHELLERVSIEARIPVPKLYLVEHGMPNAFVAGKGMRHSSIAITSGLREHLTSEEIEGVLAHLAVHVRNNTVRSRTVAAFVAYPFSRVAERCYGAFQKRDEHKKGSHTLGGIGTAFFAILTSVFIRFAVTRLQTTHADYSASLLTKNPEGLSSALRKIAKVNGFFSGGNSTAHLWFVHPFERTWYSDLFLTHPLTERRIEQIRRLEVGDPHP